MILRKVVREQILAYFESTAWTDALQIMARGRQDVLHAHIYTDSILHPRSMQRVVETYFEAKGQRCERKVKILSHGKGYTNVYYIQPPGMCHFEVFLRFNPDVVIEPMDVAAARGGKAFDYWDPAFMAAYYEKFPFKAMGAAEEKRVEDYFASDSWKRIYSVMMYDNERAIHSHCMVETSLHPEKILPIGRRAIEARGWEIDRAVSIVFGVNGLDQGKITYLVKRPELVLELEWEFNKDVVIKPAVVPIARITTTDMVDHDIEGVPYLELDSDDIRWLAERWSAR